MTVTRQTRFLVAGYPAADWTLANPVLLSREPAFETDTLKVKYGDGVTAWNSLPYAAAPLIDGDKGDIVVSSGGTVWQIDTGVIVNADVNAAAAIALSKLAAVTASRALVSDGSGVVSVSATTATELGYVNGVTSAIQTQLDGKQPLDADLTAIAGLTATTDNFIVSVSSAWASRTPAQVRTTLGLVIGTNVQAFDSDLTTWAGITPGTGVGTALAINVGSAGAFVTFNGALGTPSSGVLDNCTFPTLNQNTSGSAATLTTSRNFSITGGGITAAAVGFNGSAAVVLSASVDAGHITLARMADMATASLIYRKTAGTGAPEVQTLATLKTDLGLTGTNSGDQTITLTGDVTGSGTGSFAATIANDAVTYAKMQNVTTARVLGRTTAGSGDAEELTITGTGSVAMSAGPTFTGTLSAATIGATGFIRITSSTGGIGYATGAGGTVTQATNKATTVAINRANGNITMNNAALAAGAVVTFGMTNNAVEANDNFAVNHISGGTIGAYLIHMYATGAATASVTVTNISGGSLSEAIVIKFSLIKGSIT